jgi:hypothetical protein
MSRARPRGHSGLRARTLDESLRELRGEEKRLWRGVERWQCHRERAGGRCRHDRIGHLERRCGRRSRKREEAERAAQTAAIGAPVDRHRGRAEHRRSGEYNQDHQPPPAHLSQEYKRVASRLPAPRPTIPLGVTHRIGRKPLVASLPSNRPNPGDPLESLDHLAGMVAKPVVDLSNPDPARRVDQHIPHVGGR